MESSAPALADNQAESKFEIRVSGERAGFIEYRRLRHQQLINLIHTEVGERFEGQGLAGQLVRFALDSTREEGIGVLPSCPYVRNWTKRHPEYLDLVPEDRRPEFGL